MANSYFYSNIASPTTLSGNINNSVGSCTVAATTGWPNSTPYIIAIDYGTANEELVKVTNNASGTLTIVRGFGGTSAVSHSTGAVVRHVFNAQDITDFRTHEQATTAVHGIAGAVVGTTDAQTLTNKTLTSPTINSGNFASGGSFAGTYSGTPTFSGALVLSGTPNISNGAALAGTFSGSPTFSGNPTFSGTPVFSGTTTAMSVSGEIAHTNLYRGSRGTATDSQWEARVTGDANARFYVRTDGRHNWGPGNTLTDTNLYRSGVNALTTDGDFNIGGNLAAANITTTNMATYTPTWTTTTGAHTPSLGNATVSGTFSKVGRMTYFQLTIRFGSTTNFGSSVTTGDNWAFGLPVQAARSSDVIGWFACRPASSNSSMGHLSVDTDTTRMVLNLNTGQPNAAGVTNAGVVDSLTPFTWAANDILVMSGFYEAVS